jgi:hypothetical protein
MRHYSVAVSLVLLSLFACEPSQPLEPSARPLFRTTETPSSTNAVAVSSSRIDISWRDNSPNETGFELHRSSTGPSGAFSSLASIGANTTSYSDAGLSPSTQYCYKVRAVRRYDSKISYSSFSNTACATTPEPPPPPPPPALPSATWTVPSNSSTVTITWSDNSSNEDGFRVERTLDGGTSWTTVSTTAANVRSLPDGGRSSEQQVCHRVIAFNAGGESPPSNTHCTTPPAAPSDLIATGLDGPSIHLTWTDHSTVDEGFAVERSIDGVAFSSLAALVGSAEYHDGAVTGNTTYWYRVRARKDGGFSDFSNVANATAGSLVPPAPPVSLGTDNLQYGLSNILVYWQAGSYNADGFKVERCPGVVCGDVDFTLIATLGASSNYLLDTQVEPGSTYTYRVRAFNHAGDSAPSPEATGTACFVSIGSDGFYECS